MLAGTGWVCAAGAQEHPAAAGADLASLRATQQRLEVAREAREGQRWEEGVRKRRYDSEALAKASIEQQQAREQWDEEELRRLADEQRFREVTQAIPASDGRARREAMREEAQRRLEAAARRRAAQEEMGHIPDEAPHSLTEGELPPMPAPELPPKGLPPLQLSEVERTEPARPVQARKAKPPRR